MSREIERKDKTLRRFYTVGEVEAITRPVPVHDLPEDGSGKLS